MNKMVVTTESKPGVVLFDMRTQHPTGIHSALIEKQPTVVSRPSEQRSSLEAGTEGLPIQTPLSKVSRTQVAKDNSAPWVLLVK
jgi:hypothetical protein